MTNLQCVRLFICSASLLITTFTTKAQKHHNKPGGRSEIVSASGSFAVKFSSEPEKRLLHAQRGDSTLVSVDGVKSLKATIYGDRDSVSCYYTAFPFAQSKVVTIKSRYGKTAVTIQFNEVRACFSEDYKRSTKSRVQFVIPETYELATVVWSLAQLNTKDSFLNRESAYFQKIKDYFAPNLTHPIFKALRALDLSKWSSFEDFTQNSLIYSLKEGRLIPNGQYNYVVGDDPKFNNSFKSLLPLLEDFYRTSNFETFFRNNKPYYEQQSQRLQGLMIVKMLWRALDGNFPDDGSYQYSTYKIVFSPLNGGFHSSQDFFSNQNGQPFNETLVFIAGPDYFDQHSDWSELLKSERASEMAYWEMAPDYIELASQQYRGAIDSIFSSRGKWISQHVSPKLYPSAQSIFTAYMACACLQYWNALFGYAGFDFMPGEMEGLIRFKQFNDQFTSLGRAKKTWIAHLFPDLLQWCKTQ